MSTPPRDAGIPMLTEVIEEEGMDLAAPLPDEAETVASDRQATPLPDPGAPVGPPQTGGYAPQQGMGIQFGPPAQFAPSYPLPLKPAASATPPPAVVPEPPAERAVSPVPASPPLPAPMSEDEWQRMERRVRERILGQLLSRTDAMLEERIRSSVAGVLEQAVDSLAATLRASLHKTLEDVVSRAVAQEISRLQSTKK